MDELERHQRQQAFEHELINRRLTWLLTSQTFLFASLGFLSEMNKLKDYFLHVASGLGIAVSIFVWVGVVMGIFAKYYNWKNYKCKYDESKRWGERTWVTVIALIPDVFLPLAFIVAWGCIRCMIGEV